MQLVKMRSYWSRVGPSSSVTDVLIRGEKTHRERTPHEDRDTEGGHHVMMEGGPGMMRLQARECPRLLETLHVKRKAWNRLLFRISRRNQSCLHLDLDF